MPVDVGIAFSSRVDVPPNGQALLLACLSLCARRSFFWFVCCVFSRNICFVRFFRTESMCWGLSANSLGRDTPEGHEPSSMCWMSAWGLWGRQVLRPRGRRVKRVMSCKWNDASDHQSFLQPFRTFSSCNRPLLITSEPTKLRDQRTLYSMMEFQILYKCGLNLISSPLTPCMEYLPTLVL